MERKVIRVLLAGATGYVGGRLIQRLRKQGYFVRCLVRDRLRFSLSCDEGLEIVEGDVLRMDTLTDALSEITVAYYLVHSLGAGGDFAERDLIAADNFGRACAGAGVERIIYLSGLGRSDDDLSEHLRSRQETGERLRAGGVAVTEFRAGVILGSGSLSFEIIRNLTERLPIMFAPRWIRTRCQPISIANVLDYLEAALTVPESTGRIIEIGGAEITSYGELMIIYARVRGLKRYLIPVPFLTPHQSAYWVALITPIPANIVFPLVEGLKNEVLVTNDDALRLFPQIELITPEIAICRALEKIELDQVDTVWWSALSATPTVQSPVRYSQKEGLFLEQREILVKSNSAVAFHVLERLGGSAGWLHMDFLWRIRGFMDKLFGGVGLQRGRRRQQKLVLGDPIDFWRVEAYEENRLLRFRAEMKMPGNAWLQFRVLPEGEYVRVRMTAIFDPHGLWGRIYWYAFWPAHLFIFDGMMAELKERILTAEIHA
ncbi:MAG: NAD-dependent epimerase/dehydratase [Firmicutes bacterium]|nr:NAD-dependent epimerase/dehydratase [Bacillota bacterium]